MNIADSIDYIDTKSGFDYPSEANYEDVNETVSKYLDDFGWV